MTLMNQVGVKVRIAHRAGILAHMAGAECSK